MSGTCWSPSIHPALLPAAEVEARLEKLVEQIKAAPPIDPDRPVMLPGEVEFQRMAERQKTGIPVARETVTKLRPLAEGLGISPL